MHARKKIVRALEIRSMDDDGIFTGYGAVFGNVDSYNEVIVKGAFQNHLATNPVSATKLLWQHNPTKPIGVWQEIREDDNGLYVKGKLLKSDVMKAKEAYALLKEGAISGLSIGFSVNPNGQRFGNDGINYLTDLKLWEISVVTFPANPLANVDDVKSMTPRDFENFLRDAGGFSRSNAKRIASYCHKKGFLCDGEGNQTNDEANDLLQKLSKLNQSLQEF